jgi:hypothetical protein
LRAQAAEEIVRLASMLSRTAARFALLVALSPARAEEGGKRHCRTYAVNFARSAGHQN